MWCVCVCVRCGVCVCVCVLNEEGNRVVTIRAVEVA